MKMRVLRVTTLIVCVAALSVAGAAMAQDTPPLPAAFHSKGISPEATKVLPPQADDGRARLMPLRWPIC